jgi:hypothetical protein
MEYLPNDTIALLESTLSPGADLVNDSCNVATEDSGPLLNKDTVVLHVPVQRIDGNSGVLDD